MTEAGTPILTVEGATFGFAGRPDFLKPVTLAVQRGELWAVIGPNGAGKSTLLRMMAGLATARSGVVRLAGKDLKTIAPRDRARHIALLPQHPPQDIGLTCSEIVLLGRFPHRQFGLFESAADFSIAADAMRRTQTDVFADRPIATLSGGEAERVHVAAALAQEPDVLLLDEPTATMDLHYQLQLFDVLRELAAERHVAVVVVTHDLNLAARMCSKALLLDNGKPIAAGPPSEMMRTDVLEAVYGVSLARATAPKAAGDWIVVTGAHDAAAGGGQ